MKSVTIKDLSGKKLIKVRRIKGGFEAEKWGVMSEIDVLIVDDDNERITLHLRNENVKTAD